MLIYLKNVANKGASTRSNLLSHLLNTTSCSTSRIPRNFSGLTRAWLPIRMQLIVVIGIVIIIFICIMISSSINRKTRRAARMVNQSKQFDCCILLLPDDHQIYYTDCMHASCVNMFKNRIDLDKYLVRAGYT